MYILLHLESKISIKEKKFYEICTDRLKREKK